MSGRAHGAVKGVGDLEGNKVGLEPNADGTFCFERRLCPNIIRFSGSQRMLTYTQGLEQP